jgi:GntR family transcriptional repressor for pyruvate dehydrogenase complex
MAKKTEEDTVMFRPIHIPKPTELIIRQIYSLLLDGTLKPGDRLPTESVIASQLEVRRNEVKDALAKLEFLGVLKTIPQSGTYIDHTIGSMSLNSIVYNVLQYNQDDIPSLLDTRQMLEIRAAELAATKAKPDEMKVLQDIHSRFVKRISMGERGIDEDHAFHFKIAAFSHSPFLMNFLTMLLPEYMRLCASTMKIDDGRYQQVVDEHTMILDAILAHDAQKARDAMLQHMVRIKKNRLVEAGVESLD